MKNDQSSCSHCHCTVPSNQLVFFDDAVLCPACLEEGTRLCEHCGQRVWEEDAVMGAYTLCRACLEQHYYTCEGCGTVIHMDDVCYTDDDSDVPYCSDCVDRYSTQDIQNYYYKPEPLFYGQGPRYLGVELEIDEGGECDRSARTLLALGNKEQEFLYCKHDGSLNDGFELVSHPCTLAVHETQLPWEAVMNQAIRLGYSSHKTATCGLHVHISRNAFGTTVENQERAIARLLYFVEKHWDELLKFSRRTPRQLERWAARYGYQDQLQELLNHAKKGGRGGRYTSINLQNEETVEIRIFRGTLKHNTLIATLQLLDCICNVALFMSDDEVRGLAWTTFVTGISAERYPQLIQYLRERRLYVCDAVESEVER